MDLITATTFSCHATQLRLLTMSGIRQTNDGNRTVFSKAATYDVLYIIKNGLNSQL